MTLSLVDDYDPDVVRLLHTHLEKTNMKGSISMQLDDTQRPQQESFERLYQGLPSPQLGTLHQGLPAWEVGYPQPAFRQLVQQENIKGPVLDVGCGTGDTVLYLAEQEYEA